MNKIKTALIFFLILLSPICSFSSGISTFLYINYLSSKSSNNAVTSQIKVSTASNKENNTHEENTVTLKGLNSETLSYFTESELRKIGVVPLPEGAKVQDQYKGIYFVKSPKKSFTDNQLFFLKRFLDNAPKKLLNPGPTAIVTYDKSEVEIDFNGRQSSDTFTSGTYIFYNEEYLVPEEGSKSYVDEAYNTLMHELTHAAQFNTIVDKYKDRSVIDTYYKNNKSWDDLLMESSFVSEYASIAGWEKDDTLSTLTYKLKNSTTEKTTEYGKTHIVEDMAETVSGIVSAADFRFSEERKQWALNFLGEKYEDLKRNKFVLSEKYMFATAKNAEFDPEKEKEYKNNQNYKQIEETVLYSKDVNSIEQIQNYIQKELNIRGWSGTLKRSIDADKVITYKADFASQDRDMFIEIISFDKAINYIKKPTGTVILVINGYK